MPILTTLRPMCPVCLVKGIPLYEKLKDRLFYTDGEWSMKKCTLCKSVWLDPTPKDEEIHKLYLTYSTHSTIGNEFVPSGNTFLNKVRETLLSHEYGYGYASNPWLRYIAYLHPAWKDAQAANIFYTPYKPKGLLLDVGCGNGSSMQMMARIGWQVVGTDFDKEAVKEAKSKGLDVRLGELKAIAFPNQSFDAIMMNHVIEHVQDPLHLLKECRRILKKGGTLVMITPNATSRGHAIFKKDWRPLETPQHLQVFSIASLRELTKKAGFEKVEAFSSIQGAYYILESSYNLKIYNDAHKVKKTTTLRKFWKHFAWFVLGWIHVISPSHAEVAVVRASYS